MDQPKDLISIGTFANMTRLSIKALRLYDQLGILAPLHIDPQTGYRYYGVDQLSKARMIRNIRDMDMPLATIRRMLAVIPVSQAQAELLVQQHLETRERQLELIRGPAFSTIPCHRHARLHGHFLLCTCQESTSQQWQC